MSIRNTSSLAIVSTRWSGREEGVWFTRLNDTEWRRESSTGLYRLREMDGARGKEREGRKPAPKVCLHSTAWPSFLRLWPLRPTACHNNTLIFPKNPLGSRVHAIGTIFTALAVLLVWKSSGPFDTGKIGRVLKHISVSRCDKHRAWEPLLPISSW